MAKAMFGLNDPDWMTLRHPSTAEGRMEREDKQLSKAQYGLKKKYRQSNGL
jgi:hypothetical protein